MAKLVNIVQDMDDLYKRGQLLSGHEDFVVDMLNTYKRGYSLSTNQAFWLRKFHREYKESGAIGKSWGE